MTPPVDRPSYEIVIEIGGIPIKLQTTDPEFDHLLKARYGDYVTSGTQADFTFEMDLTPPGTYNADADAEVWLEGREWHMRRGDFRAQWSEDLRRGSVHQSVNPYSVDAVLRITHSLLLARTGGFLLHASSAVRNGKAYLFSGLSEAGKTTISRLAPPDVTLLTDEVSYVRLIDNQYFAYGTPFAGELGEPGKNISAPIAAVYLLGKASENRIFPIEPAQAIRRLMRNILFFAHDPELVRKVFESACNFVASVPVSQLSFFPDQRVWELIG